METQTEGTGRGRGKNVGKTAKEIKAEREATREANKLLKEQTAKEKREAKAKKGGGNSAEDDIMEAQLAAIKGQQVGILQAKGAKKGTLHTANTNTNTGLKAEVVTEKLEAAVEAGKFDEEDPFYAGVATLNKMIREAKSLKDLKVQISKMLVCAFGHGPATHGIALWNGGIIPLCKGCNGLSHTVVNAAMEGGQEEEEESSEEETDFAEEQEEVESQDSGNEYFKFLEQNPQYRLIESRKLHTTVANKGPRKGKKVPGAIKLGWEFGRRCYLSAKYGPSVKAALEAGEKTTGALYPVFARDEGGKWIPYNKEIWALEIQKMEILRNAGRMRDPRFNQDLETKMVADGQFTGYIIRRDKATGKVAVKVKDRDCIQLIPVTKKTAKVLEAMIHVYQNKGQLNEGMQKDWTVHYIHDAWTIQNVMSAAFPRQNKGRGDARSSERGYNDDAGPMNPVIKPRRPRR